MTAVVPSFLLHAPPFALEASHDVVRGGLSSHGKEDYGDANRCCTVSISGESPEDNSNVKLKLFRIEKIYLALSPFNITFFMKRPIPIETWDVAQFCTKIK